jgi:predicted nucleic acid-binding protein
VTVFGELPETAGAPGSETPPVLPFEDLDAALPARLVERQPIPLAAAFLAGKCFLKYRRRGGMRQSTLPDFFIGAHAAVEGMTLLTRDAARYKTYFPRLKLICPE